MALTDTESRARFLVWAAAQDKRSVHLTAEEASALWSTILDDSQRIHRAEDALARMTARLTELYHAGSRIAALALPYSPGKVA